ncbi:hypothetical protein H0G86_005372 [Trichoderma simmonsii]|uniref:Uncharacterized protein n=1 Tax=Trichoderma simmonsii TaxID=1491479 RepID=A0A8G0LEH6_9HYPO|nr:hypothetical protein H0G86_005372 [Trichoderma simmonsii]
MAATGMHAVQRICILVLESALSCDFASLPEIYACADTNNMLQLLSSSQAAQGFNSQVGGGANISVALLQASYSKTFKICMFLDNDTSLQARSMGDALRIG